MIRLFGKDRSGTGPDNLALGPDGQANHVLALWGSGTAEAALENDLTFLPGLELHADPALGMTGRYRSPAGWLLEIEAEMTGAGKWFALHLALPAQDLTGYGVLGFALRASANGMHIVRACLRSGLEDGGFQDYFFDKHILLRPEEATHLDALPLRQIWELPIQAPWREIVLFLPPQDIRLSLIDLRVFIV